MGIQCYHPDGISVYHPRGISVYHCTRNLAYHFHLPFPGHTWQEEKNWGYLSYKSSEELTAAYLELLVKLEPMLEKGLSAAVYTQTTDVEIEVNGLMTYDRELIKMDKDKAAEVNRKLVKGK